MKKLILAKIIFINGSIKWMPVGVGWVSSYLCGAILVNPLTFGAYIALASAPAHFWSFPTV